MSKNINEIIDKVKPIIDSTAIIINEVNESLIHLQVTVKSGIKTAKNGINLTKDVYGTIKTIKAVSTGNITELIKLFRKLNLNYKLKRRAA
jgi:hypothetical protein